MCPFALARCCAFSPQSSGSTFLPTMETRATHMDTLCTLSIARSSCCFRSCILFLLQSHFYLVSSGATFFPLCHVPGSISSLALVFELGSASCISRVAISRNSLNTPIRKFYMCTSIYFDRKTTNQYELNSKYLVQTVTRIGCQPGYKTFSDERWP